ncbi:GNAT family N-acetyltransferase [Streptacidiphilus sp. PB12-B1b]|uniref:GNAT family N-acetyltransferase n=1 Tax=Streptacidiphilus sp. PB12-B1b TaxID=2705012 RepID=UPI0015FACA56|nr:GNAT family N-acetyltransferase [Streptacidiphilus sp. PB12-B1b]QMU75185.1 GNAT family N-acetyltransferase [Streptacidiphilus sp. PB12-B1b]
MADNTIGRGRAEVQITRADLGRRVSVRRISGVSQGRPVFADVVGLLTSWDEGVLVVVDRHDTAVSIAEETLVAARAVPPAPVRRGRGAVAAHLAVDPDELQRIAGRGWPGAESEPLGGWTLRAAGGFTNRANSVLTAGDPGLPLEQALDRATAWYAARGLPAALQVRTDDPLDAELAARGWGVRAAALTQTAPLAPLVDDAAAAAAGVRLDRQPGPAWLSRYRRVTGPDLAPTALAVLTGGPSVWFATVPGAEGEPPAAIGRCAVDGRWAGLAALEVAPGQRRRGLATAVTAALARAAADEGADLVYLQVEPDNAAAIALYERLGFRTHHRYHYRRRPGA